MPINIIEPLLSSYAKITYPLSLIYMNENTHPWIFQNFIALDAYKHHKHGTCWIEHHSALIWRICPYLNVQLFSREFINKNYPDKTKFYRDLLDLNFAIFDCINYKHLLNSKINHNFYHETLIYGYEENNFNIASFFNGNKFGFYVENKNAIENASYIDPDSASKIQNQFQMIVALKYNNYLYFNFDIKRCINDLTEYLAAETLDFKYEKGFPALAGLPCDFYFGIDVYNHLFNVLEQSRNEKIIDIDYRGFKTISDHKQLLLELVKYLYNNKYISNQDHIEIFDNIYKESLLFLNIILKFSVKKSVDYDLIYNKLQSQKNHEEKAISGLLKELQS